MPRLFNNDKIKERFANNDHIPGGQVGQAGADNVLFSDVRNQILGYSHQIENVEAEYELVLPANSLFFYVFFKVIESTPTVGVGSSTGNYDLMTPKTISTQDGLFMITPIINQTSLFLGVTGGKCTINILYIEKFF